MSEGGSKRASGGSGGSFFQSRAMMISPLFSHRASRLSSKTTRLLPQGQRKERLLSRRGKRQREQRRRAPSRRAKHSRPVCSSIKKPEESIESRPSSLRRGLTPALDPRSLPSRARARGDKIHCRWWLASRRGHEGAEATETRAIARGKSKRRLGLRRRRLRSTTPF